MSLYDYTAAKRLWLDDTPFYALIMAAMYRADTINAAKLQAAFPETWAELDARYNAPGGLLEGENLRQPLTLAEQLEDSLPDGAK